MIVIKKKFGVVAAVVYLGVVTLLLTPPLTVTVWEFNLFYFILYVYIYDEYSCTTSTTQCSDTMGPEQSKVEVGHGFDSGCG